MLNALLMLGSTNQKMKKINFLCVGVWIAYMLMNANLETGLAFTIVNLIIFLGVVTLGKLAKGKCSNTVVSVFSILIWSVLIDVVCFYMYPQFAITQNILGYIESGILFNLKYAFSNAIVLAFVYACDFVTNKLSKAKEGMVSSI